MEKKFESYLVEGGESPSYPELQVNSDCGAILKIPLKKGDEKKLDLLSKAQKILGEAGIFFDMGYSYPEEKMDWKMDWALSGANIKCVSVEGERSGWKDLESYLSSIDHVEKTIKENWEK